MEHNIIIRSYQNKDKSEVRRINIDTAFMGRPSSVFFSGDEIVADCLTLYFTDYEPESCFVAEENNRLAGYIIGAKNASKMRKIFAIRILPKILLKSIFTGVFLRIKNLYFLFRVIKSCFSGEFRAPQFTDEYPATLHINLDSNFRGRKIGTALMNAFTSYLKENNIPGVHCQTVNPKAGDFFVKHGFIELLKEKRTYWKRYLNKDIYAYVFGKKIGV